MHSSLQRFRSLCFAWNKPEHGNFLLSAFENPEELPGLFSKAFNTSYDKAEIVMTAV